MATYYRCDRCKREADPMRRVSFEKHMIMSPNLVDMHMCEGCFEQIVRLINNFLSSRIRGEV